MTTRTDKTMEPTEAPHTLTQLVSEVDDGAAQLAMDVEAVADECELVSRRLAELRADVARQRVLLDELSRADR